MAEWAELRRELDDTRAGLCRLREQHARTRNEREEIGRLRAFANSRAPSASPISRSTKAHFTSASEPS
jgi:type II secretory pathway component PulM